MNVEILRGFTWQNQGAEETLNIGDQRMVPDTVGRHWVRNGWARERAGASDGPRTMAPPETKRAGQRSR